MSRELVVIAGTWAETPSMRIREIGIQRSSVRPLSFKHFFIYRGETAVRILASGIAADWTIKLDHHTAEFNQRKKMVGKHQFCLS